MISSDILVLRIQKDWFRSYSMMNNMALSYDMLVLYGRSTVLADLDVRSDGSAGDRAHRDAVTDEMSRIVEDQDVGQSTEPARPVRR